MQNDTDEEWDDGFAQAMREREKRIEDSRRYSQEQKRRVPHLFCLALAIGASALLNDVLRHGLRYEQVLVVVMSPIYSAIVTAPYELVYMVYSETWAKHKDEHVLVKTADVFVIAVCAIFLLLVMWKYLRTVY